MCLLFLKVETDCLTGLDWTGLSFRSLSGPGSFVGHGGDGEDCLPRTRHTTRTILGICLYMLG